MAAPQRTETPDTRDGSLSYVHTDASLPPVAIIDRSPIGIGHKVFFGAVAVLGAVAWTIIAFVRGETVNAVWFVVAAICTYVIGYRFYARLIEAKIVHPRDDHATPAEVIDDGIDYVPTDRRVLFGHHFAAIAGAGPSSGRCWPPKWVICRAASGSSSARWSPVACRTTWCCGFPPGAGGAR